MFIHFLLSNSEHTAIIMHSLALNKRPGSNHESGHEYSSLNLSGGNLLEVSCQDPSLSLVGVNQYVKLSAQGVATESSKVDLENMNEDQVFHPHPNVNQEILTHCDDGVDAPMSKEEDENDVLPDTISRNSHKKPGVILLGRGNSFSLGRSEVMLLHANRRNRKSMRKDNCNQLGSVEDSDNIQNNNSPNIKTFNNRNLNDSANPGSIYQMASEVVMNQTHKTQESAFLLHDLESLWQKAELVMAAKETVVQQVLEEFGIGEAGSSADETEEKVIEETIWQAVQDNFHT